MIGQTLGHYRVLEQIGAGGMGLVFRAHDERLDRDVALKVLPPGTLGDENARRRFRKEALTLSKLNHPNIETVFDFDMQDGVDFLVMELIAGTTLDQKLATGALPEKDVLRLGQQLAEGLAAAHDQSVIHRDLKPGNLSITPDGRLKILDFGLAKLLQPASNVAVTESLSETRGAVGTLPYMAPEQLRGEKADARSDIWAAGAVLYEMATGRRPFDARLSTALAGDIQHKPPPSPQQLNPELSPRVEELILKCLEKDPEDRYQSAKELTVDLRRLAAPASSTLVAQPAKGIRKTALVASLALVLALVAAVAILDPGGLRERLLGRTQAPRIESVAVLPLENLSGDPEQDYLADGVHEALITDLAKLGGFQRVIARSSVMRYRKSEKPLAQIARELHVDALITGSVLRSGTRVQVTAHLLNPATEEQIWGDRYERELRDVLSLQNDIVTAITRGIKLKLAPDEQQRLASARAVNPEAYEAYLKGRFHVAKFTSDGFERGLAYLHQAVEKDPTNPLAHSQLAVAYSMIGHDKIPDAFVQAKSAARKALELDPNSAEAYEVLAEIKLYSDWDDWSGAEQAFRQALALNPNLAMAHRNYSWYLNMMGRSAEGIAEMKRATEIDPMSPLFSEDLGWQYWDIGQSDKAIEEARKSLELDPNFPYAHLLLALAHAERGRYTEAIAAGQKAAHADPDLRFGLAVAYARAGRKDLALRIAAEIKKQPSPWGDWGLAEVYAALGDREEALRWLDQAFQDRFSLMPWLRLRDAGLERPFKPFRHDPRYQDLLRRMNLAE